MAKKITLSPLYDKILARRISAEEKVGNLIIPDVAQEKPHIGIVVAIGHGVPMDDGSMRPLKVKPGDQIMWDKYGGVEISLNGDSHVILQESELYGIVKETK